MYLYLYIFLLARKVTLEIFSRKERFSELWEGSVVLEIFSRKERFGEL
jgi:hypothetical protein